MSDCCRRRREGISWRAMTLHGWNEANKVGNVDVQISQTATYSNAIHAETKCHVSCFRDRVLLGSTAGRN